MSENSKNSELRPEDLAQISGGGDASQLGDGRFGGRRRTRGFSWSVEQVDTASERKPEERTGELQPRPMP